jgi:type III pantothenate kinase
MRLLIDAGNSRLKWAVASGSRLGQGGTISAEELAQGGLASLFNSLGELPGGVWVANVAGREMQRRLLAAAQGLPASAWHFQTSQAHFMGLTNGYRQPELLGVDRWLAMLAAYTRMVSAVCVMDAGSACTLDAVGSDGGHLGGVIVPGIGMMQASLRRDTSDIDLHTRLSRGDDAGLFAHSTAGAIASGSVHALAALAERGFEELARICGETPTLVLSGGDGDLIAGHCKVNCIVVPELVLEGLNLVAENQ